MKYPPKYILGRSWSFAVRYAICPMSLLMEMSKLFAISASENGSAKITRKTETDNNKAVMCKSKVWEL